jgi:hypothetical protein
VFPRGQLGLQDAVDFYCEVVHRFLNRRIRGI